ncbi:3-hydroxyacyl-CoA dehydrogenase NAD-binding domain-containing protein [Streptomyces sp. NPDC056975]|uniref:3-hydroxyacyl-CoA dehydrogenase NAD-binding domain-containing protein n=1 Tax=Streptomyces sp. NPDC056975 TaxID=3345985 RepID=UPI003633BBFD
MTTSQRPAVSARFDSEVLSSRLRCLAELGEVSAVVLQQSLRDVESAYRNFFATLDKVIEDPEAILASNTSSIPIMKLAGATGRPDQVMGTYFFNPVPAMPLVELVGSLHTSDASMDRAESGVAQTLDKQPIRSKDLAGFVVGALLVPYLSSACAWWGRASPPSRTSARAWCSAARTQWARCG